MPKHAREPFVRGTRRKTPTLDEVVKMMEKVTGYKPVTWEDIQRRRGIRPSAMKPVTWEDIQKQRGIRHGAMSPGYKPVTWEDIQRRRGSLRSAMSTPDPGPADLMEPVAEIAGIRASMAPLAARILRRDQNPASSSDEAYRDAQLAHRRRMDEMSHEQWMSAHDPEQGVQAGPTTEAALRRAALSRAMFGRSKFDEPAGATNPLGNYPTEMPQADKGFAGLPLSLRQRILMGEPVDEELASLPQYGKYRPGTILPRTRTRVTSGVLTSGPALIGPRAIKRAYAHGVGDISVSPVAPMGQERADELARRNLMRRLGLTEGDGVPTDLQSLREMVRASRKGENERRRAMRQVILGRKSGNSALAQMGMQTLQSIAESRQQTEEPRDGLPPLPVVNEEGARESAIPIYVGQVRSAYSDPARAADRFRELGVTAQDLLQYMDELPDYFPTLEIRESMREWVRSVLEQMTGANLHPDKEPFELPRNNMFKRIGGFP